MDYCLLIPSQSRVLCRGEQLLLTFFREGSRQLKLNRAGFKVQGAESAGRLFSTWCSSTCRSTCKLRDLKSPAPIPDQGSFHAHFPESNDLPNYRHVIIRLSIPTGFRQALSMPNSPQPCSSPWRS